jgi:hypothetical protein
MSAALDLLELELRRLDGVVFVGFVERTDTLVIQILAAPAADRTVVRERALELARLHIERPVVVDVVGEQRGLRVRILAVDTEDDEKVEIRLGHNGKTAMARGDGTSPYGVAAATVAALVELGADVPFEVQQAAIFDHEEREGVMVVLARAGSTGSLYGAAAAESMQQAAVRATLHALNRHLATTAFLLRPGH